MEYKKLYENPATVIWAYNSMHSMHNRLDSFEYGVTISYPAQGHELQDELRLCFF